MSRVEKTISLSPLVSKEICFLVKSGRFASKSDVVRTALRVLKENNPEYGTEIAVELYKEGEVSLGRAAEIGGIDRESFREVLKERGMEIEKKPREGMDERVKEVEERQKE